jgi:hypothetical protein
LSKRKPVSIPEVSTEAMYILIRPLAPSDSLQFKLPGQGEDMHPQYRGKPKPDFEGDVNPKTGEVGGPKKDPLRWETSWDYNGRCTDF